MLVVGVRAVAPGELLDIMHQVEKARVAPRFSELTLATFAVDLGLAYLGHRRPGMWSDDLGRPMCQAQ